MTKRVYSFGNKTAEGNSQMKNLLGGKGANLAEMNLIGVPVPPGFTITTNCCNEYNKLGSASFKTNIKPEIESAIAQIEQIMHAEFGGTQHPLLVSVRSGARVSMPGMMDTVLNLGMNDKTVEILAQKSGNERFAWDSYRRFVQMYGDVVLGMKPATAEDEDPFEELINEMKTEKGIQNDTELDTEDLKLLVSRFKKAVKTITGKDFPDNCWDQLWEAIYAVFDSWMNERAILYRKLQSIPEEWGTAVNVQAMVFGNMGNSSGTGVAFTRDASTGEDVFNGEYLINAQGEDVVAGTRTPQQITKKGSVKWAELAGVSEKERSEKYPSLEEAMPSVYQELFEIQEKLEAHYKDMQDLEFTIQDKKLWLLQTRNGKRTGQAMVKIAMDMLQQGILTEQEALLRQEPQKLDELLHPVFSPDALASAKVVAKGLPASPGAAFGQIVFFAEDAEILKAAGKDAILVRTETSPEDLKGMHAANGILTARGGMTSHAAVVARGMGKCCVSGAGSITIHYKNRTMTADGKTYNEGDFISLNGSTGEVYEGRLETQKPSLSGDFLSIMKLSDKYRKLGVRTNADTPHDAETAMQFGAQGIGLCRTEHMFFEGHRIVAMREMILADDLQGRQKALAKLLPIQKGDFYEIFKAMAPHPVTVRLLDPPLHEFVPHDEKSQQEIANDMGVSQQAIKEKIESLEEVNPMLGHRGCRLGNSYPEITEMQTRAIIEAALDLHKEGISVKPEIMVPLIGTVNELKEQKKYIEATIQKVFDEQSRSIEYFVGTMIEVPRAALTAEKIAPEADFFSFGTNDLTQMTFGYSRDDSGKFLSHYIDTKVLPQDPFQAIDQEGVGQLVKLAAEKGRSVKPSLKLGICGEHGGEPSSIEFCHQIGLNYVSCSPFRVPIARLAAAQAALK